jgi:hypothetical protein
MKEPRRMRDEYYPRPHVRIAMPQKARFRTLVGEEQESRQRMNSIGGSLTICKVQRYISRGERI